jgi:hypothetical protein
MATTSSLTSSSAVDESIVRDTEEYDKPKGEELASWIWEQTEDDGAWRKANTREESWKKDWEFLRGRQWDGPMPSYRRPVKMNAWRRANLATNAVLLGGRPTMKLIPQGQIEEAKLKIWQDALWAVLKREQFYETHAPDAYQDALVGDGGWWKFGYGRWAENSGEDPDVLISCPHPSQVYPDKDCTDVTLAKCHHIAFKDRLDLATITARYPGRGLLVTPDDTASIKWGGGVPEWVGKKDITTIGPSGGWSANANYRRGMADVIECWTDDPATEIEYVDEVLNLKQVVQAWLDKVAPSSYEERGRLIGLGGRDVPQVGELLPRLREKFGNIDIEPEIGPVERFRWKYPKGRVVTCTRKVILRDIPNPFSKAFAWPSRWPFVYVPGCLEPHTVWRPGILSDMADIQYAINKGLSLLLENEIKVTNAMVIADEGAMDEEEWDMLQLFPGCKIQKNQGTELNVVFPQPLPPQAFQFPDYMIRKLDEQVGLADPQIAPGQAVSSKTVAFMQQKGSLLLGILAKGMDEANERAGARIMGLMRDRYLPNKMIPYFEGEEIKTGMSRPLPELPGSLQVRVEATSASQELQQTSMVMAQAAEAARAERRR